VERAIAERALASPEIRRLLTVPGVDMITAATFMAFVGDIARFGTPRQLVGYFGLDPKVRQSGSGPARHGRISKEGASEARHVLCEAAKAAARTPGPLRAFAHRVRARRGSNIATVAVARKLCVLFWHLLTTSEDYAYGRPSLTAKKLRRLELLLGAPPRRGRTPGVPAGYGRKALRDQERELTTHAEHAYRAGDRRSRREITLRRRRGRRRGARGAARRGGAAPAGRARAPAGRRCRGRAARRPSARPCAHRRRPGSASR
jgi:transposase